MENLAAASEPNSLPQVRVEPGGGGGGGGGGEEEEEKETEKETEKAKEKAKAAAGGRDTEPKTRTAHKDVLNNRMVNGSVKTRMLIKHFWQPLFLCCN